jgi:hypothetical protein
VYMLPKTALAWIPVHALILTSCCWLWLWLEGGGRVDTFRNLTEELMEVTILRTITELYIIWCYMSFNYIFYRRAIKEFLNIKKILPYVGHRTRTFRIWQLQTLFRIPRMYAAF